MRNFAEEMRRGMGKGMIAAMLMTLLPMLIAVMVVIPNAQPYTEKTYACGIMVNALHKSGVAPVAFIAAAFAYSTSYMTDRNAGALKYQMMRCGRLRFAVDRFFANAICGALGVILAQLLLYLIMRSIYPVMDIPYHYLGEVNAMQRLEYVNPELNMFVSILLQIPCLMVMASVALATSTFVNNTYVTLASPIVYFGLMEMMPPLPFIGDMRAVIYWAFQMSTEQWQYGYARCGIHMLYCAVMLMITFAVFYMGVRRYKGE